MMSNMQTVAQRNKRNTLRDAIAGGAIVLLVGFWAIAFSESSRETVAPVAAEAPTPAQVENPIDPEQLICTPESLAAVC